MTELNGLSEMVSQFAGLTPQDFELSMPFWNQQVYKKGDYYNQYKTVCKYLGFVVEGTFRSFVIDEKTGEEKNIFFYSDNQFVKLLS